MCKDEEAVRKFKMDMFLEKQKKDMEALQRTMRAQSLKNDTLNNLN